MRIHGVEHHLYRWEVPGEQLPLIALHGFTGSGADFAPLAQRLGRTIVAPDLVGHGATGVPEDPWDMPRVVESVSRMIESLGWERYGVLGYSMGGRIGFSWATTRPKGLLALIGVGVNPGLSDASERAERVRADEALAERALSLGAESFLDEWSELPLMRTQRNIPEVWRTAMRESRGQHVAAGLAASLRGHGTGAMEPIWEHLSELQVPALLLAGERDEKFVSLGQKMAQRLSRGEFQVVEGAGHCAHLEALERFVECADRFLGVVDGGTERYPAC